MNFLISFIIPVYNVEKYLTDCIHSLINQTYPHFEIILIDDESTDLSSKICDDFALKDQRIKVFHIPHSGSSEARNVGIQKASGDYFIFVDSDDFWINKHSLQTLINELRQTPNYDFINFNCSYYYPSKNKYKKWTPYLSSACSDKNETIQHLVKSGTVPMSACLKVIRRNMFENKDLFFIKGIYSEDIPWFITLLEKSKKYKFSNLYIYAYRKEVPNSISSSFSTKKYDDLLWVINHELKKLTNSKWDQKGKNALLSFLAYEYCILLGMSHFFPKDKRIERQQELASLSYLLQYASNPKVRYVKWTYKLLGLKITSSILNLYLSKCKVDCKSPNL